MKKLIVPILALLLLAFATPVFAEWEMGMAWTPMEDPSVPSTYQTLDSIPSYHVGYAWGILYATWDALAMPAYWVEYATDGYYNVPGFLNLLDAGVRFNLKPLVLFAEVGVNSLYVYREGLLNGNFGANLRVGVGAKFGWWGFGVTGTEVFASFDDLAATIGGLFNENDRSWAWNNIVSGLVPSVYLTLYF